MNKSSILPVVSDVLSAGISKYNGDTIAGYVAGPSFGTAQDIANIYKATDKTKATWRFAKRNLLPSNWVPLKAVTRHAFDYDLISKEIVRE